MGDLADDAIAYEERMADDTPRLYASVVTYDVEANPKRSPMTRSKSKPKLPTTWLTRDEGTVLIVDMADSHLDNAIAMLERNCQKIAANEAFATFFKIMDDELPDGVFNALHTGANDLHRIAQDPLKAAAWMKERPEYRALVKERKRRKKAGKNQLRNKERWLLAEAFPLISNGVPPSSIEARREWLTRWDETYGTVPEFATRATPEDAYEREA